MTFSEENLQPGSVPRNRTFALFSSTNGEMNEDSAFYASLGRIEVLDSVPSGFLTAMRRQFFSRG